MVDDNGTENKIVVGSNLLITLFIPISKIRNLIQISLRISCILSFVRYLCSYNIFLAPPTSTRREHFSRDTRYISNHYYDFVYIR